MIERSLSTNICPGFGARRLADPRHLAAATLMALTSGCQSAPSITIAGAYFPAWLACALLAGAVAIAARALFVFTGLSRLLPLQLLVCLSIGAAVGALSCALWMEGWR